MPNTWPDVLAFGLKNSIIVDENLDENWWGKWISDPKNRLVLVLPELVVRRGQDLKRLFLLAESHSFGCICKVGAWKGHTMGNVIFVCQNRFFQFPPGRGSSSIAGALEGVGAWKSDFCLPKTVFFLLELVPWGVGAWKSDFRLPKNVFSVFLQSWFF